jgi:ankyrin repeat protein
MAALNGEVEVVRFLVESGDDQNVLGDLGATPLHIAAERGHLETRRTVQLGFLKPVTMQHLLVDITAVMECVHKRIIYKEKLCDAKSHVFG